MARMSRTGTRLTAREVRGMYPGLNQPAPEDDEDVYDHNEIVAPEWTSRPCGCVTTSCPQCKPLWYDADGNYIRRKW